MTRIRLIGDYNEAVPAHQAIPVALKLAGDALGIAVDFAWVPTERIRDSSRFASFDGLWCVPGAETRKKHHLNGG